MEQSQQQPTQLTQAPAWQAYVVAGIGFLISLLLWYSLVVQSEAHLHRALKQQMEDVTDDIHTQLKLRISALKHMAKHLEKQKIKGNAEWQESVAAYLNDYAGFQAISWLSPKLHPYWTTPENNPKIQSLFKNFIQQHADAIHNTVSQQKIWLSPPIHIPPFKDRIGFFVVIPLTIENQLKGVLVSLINANDLLNIQLNRTNYSVAMFANVQKIFQYGPDIINTHTPWLFTRTLNLYGATWKIAILPSAKLIASFKTPLPWLTLILGLSISILFAATLRLSQLTRERAKLLAAINQDLKNEITQRTQAEETQKKLEKDLLQGQKLQAIGTLAGGIAHDFNNILYAITGYTEMAREDVPQDNPLYKNLGKILEASHRGKDLVARILAFSRHQHHHLVPLPLKTTIENALALLRPTIPASVAINFITDPHVEDDHILGNQTQLHQVIMNIVNNAVDAMNGEGAITIHLSQVLANDIQLQQLPKISPGNYCKIAISDTGAGMDATTMERMFEPFFTTKEVGKGTGLGLATVHAIIEEHQGAITVASELGRGTRFTLYIPTLDGGKHG